MSNYLYKNKKNKYMNKWVYIYKRKKRKYAYIYMLEKNRAHRTHPPPINPVLVRVHRRVRGCVQLLNENEVRTWKKTSNGG